MQIVLLFANRESLNPHKDWLQGIITGIIMEVHKTLHVVFVPITHAATAGFIHDQRQWRLDLWT